MSPMDPSAELRGRLATRMTAYAILAVGGLLFLVVVWRDPASSFAGLCGIVAAFWTIQLWRAIRGRDWMLIFQAIAEFFGLTITLYFIWTQGGPLLSWARVEAFAGLGFGIGSIAMVDAVRCHVFSEVGTKKGQETGKPAS